MMKNEQMDNILEDNGNTIKAIKEIIAWRFCVMTNFVSRQGVVDRHRSQFVAILIPCFLVWLYEVVFDINLYEHLANACWNEMNYIGNSILNQSPSDVKSEQLNILCFAESKLVESSERRMFLVLLLSGALHSSVRRALWKYVTLLFKWFIKDEFWGMLWSYITSYFKKFNEDDLSRGVQATSPTVIDGLNPVCVINSNIPWDSRHCVLSGGVVLTLKEYYHFNSCKTGFIVLSVSCIVTFL